MKLVPVLLSLLLFACGDSGNSGPPPIKNCGASAPSVLSTLCLPQAQWSVAVAKSGFPKNILFRVNDYVALNECHNPKLYPMVVTRKPDVYIEAEQLFTPSPHQALKIEIIDLGKDCLEYETYYFNESQEFHVTQNKDKDNLVEFVIE